METPEEQPEDIEIIDESDSPSDPEEEIKEVSPSRWSGLPVRIASACILAGSFVLLLSIGGWLFSWFVFMAALIMIREWNNLTKKQSSMWRFAGLFYVSIPCASLLWLRSHEEGMALVLFVVLCVAATDVGAYFTGKQFGKTKLSPALSPNKTWEGLGGGAVAAGIAGVFVSLYAPFPATIWGGMFLGALLAVVSQGGDLFESYLKRRAGVKDSGTLIPGHGGILDRIDGLIPTLPLFALLVALS